MTHSSWFSARRVFTSCAFVYGGVCRHVMCLSRVSLLKLPLTRSVVHLLCYCVHYNINIIYLYRVCRFIVKTCDEFLVRDSEPYVLVLTPACVFSVNDGLSLCVQCCLTVF